MAWINPGYNDLEELEHPLDSEDIIIDGEFDDEDIIYYDEGDFEFLGAENLEGW